MLMSLAVVVARAAIRPQLPHVVPQKRLRGPEIQ